MKDLNYFVDKYKEQLDKGDIQEGYVGLVKYLTRLSTNLSKNLIETYSFGSLFQGYMDYTYFYYTNDFLKKRKLKMGLVLNHTKMQFEIWLLGQTIPIQEKYWEYFKLTKWNKDRTTRPQYSILETVLIDKPNFNDLEELTRQIENKLVSITSEIIEEIKRSKLT
ncbi:MULTISPECIES: DUF7000 family protein [Flavobacterium]|uniref:DUF7000 domain-containing protein n=2 Tax=Flavobacterium TaxID=237 RepID=A0A437U9J0_9FLAO|nr:MULTISPECIES: hypothetical protein [Flavobacterium]OWP83080.1 hypothetical protein BWK59_12430 [Flavobacterium davisii]QYS89014.1 hypothetical protein JJC05_00705 [Flavobacterium davisii]RVU90241.1 hypothetical protein EH230_04625 [Flavobacterium columnare]SPE78671.1 hypothetical protein FLACOL_02689 [Flavobacterium columnare]